MRADSRAMRSVLVVSCLLAASSCGDADASVRAGADILFSLDARRQPLPAAAPALVQFGAALATCPLAGRACLDCHDPARAGQDGLVHGRNTKTILDATRAVAFGWTGATKSLTAMVEHELGAHGGVADDAVAAAQIGADPALAAGHVAAFGDAAPTRKTMAQALTAWLQTKRTDGRWDRYLDGDDTALTAAERHGLQTFLNVGCATCHAGRNLGGATTHKLGLARPYPDGDPGLAEVTGKPTDRQVFLAPALRRVASTGPWLHDGSVDLLPEAIRLMARHELGRDLDDTQVNAVEVFLKAVGDDSGRVRNAR